MQKEPNDPSGKTLQIKKIKNKRARWRAQGLS